MAVVGQKNVAHALMQKTVQRQEALARLKLKFVPKQVEQVLMNVQRGINAPYIELVRVLRNYPLNDENFEYVIEDCLNSVVLLGKSMKTLVDAICDLEWEHRSKDLVELYCQFLVNLVTAHTYHCAKVMSCLVRSFKAEGTHWEGSPDAEQVTKWSNSHKVIAQIVAIMPLTSDLLMKTIVQEFPYYKSGSFVNRSYVHNLIWMSRYLPAFKDQIMMAIINRMIIMDVNIVESQKNKPLDTQFEMDVEENDEVSDSLDFCMLEVLKWLEDEREPIMNLMCSVFENIVLPTYGIRHVQFLLLYTISINQQCADRVLNHLWTVAAGRQESGPGASATRRTAASHLSGLLARCVRVPNSRLIHYLRLMAEWCHSYINAVQDTTASDNLKAHAAFHAMCHAVFYLVAFKHHHLFSSKENVNFVESLNLPRLVTCNLNPLRTCPPAVTRAFSSVTRSHQVVYCQAIIERNQRHTLHRFVQHDEWFPYDPYTLPRSGNTIWPLCVEYKDWPSDDTDETQYSGMTKKLDAEDDDFLMHASPVQKYASSLSHCISPGFKSSDNILLN